MSLIYNATFDSQTRILSLLDKSGNVISSCEVPSKGDPLTLTATANNSSVKLIKNGTLSNTFEVNAGSGWTAYEFGTVIPLNAGQSCKWRCKSHPTTQNGSNYVKFVMTGTIEASGNVNSMLSSDFEGITSLTGYDHAFGFLFNSCVSLTQAPELPATALAVSCYNHMFNACVSLTQAPELPATTLKRGCYNYMFRGCSNLTKAPELPATILAESCYNYMFSGCSNLKEVRISATTTATNALANWLENVAATGDFYCDPNATIFPTDSASGIPKGWSRFVLGAEDAGNTTTMYHNGASETVRVGTSSYGTCYALQGWVGFKSLAQMHEAGYSLGTQTPITMYNHDIPVSAYSCEANAEDGFTETMYDVGDGKGYLTIAQQNVNGFYLVSTPYTGLTLTATADNSSVKLTKKGTLSNTFEVDTGKGWQSYTFGTVINLNNGQSCKWRCKAHPTTQSTNNYAMFVMEGTIEASGNCNSMLSSDFENLTSLAGYDYAFCQLFYRCSSLTQAPNLPATTLASYCYSAMFYRCSSLTQAPNLPATTLASYCYKSMFYECISLKKAPLLPATTLANHCYESMFYGCGSLKEVRISATNDASSALTQWLEIVASTGDFYCDPNATIFQSGSSGIPSGWNRRNIADYPSTP